MVVQYDLEERTLQFAKEVRVFVRRLPRTISNIEDGKQLIRASGSVGANYIEANEALTKKDKCYRMRISRKEAKESRYWLLLVNTNNRKDLEIDRQRLIQEAQELKSILSTILNNLEHKKW